MTDEDRAALAKEMGYNRIGKELPDDVTLGNIVQSMPKDVGIEHQIGNACGVHRHAERWWQSMRGSCRHLRNRARQPAQPHTHTHTHATPQVFELDHGKAFGAVLTSIVSMSVCLYLIHISPWYLLPACWALAGTAFTGFFVVGHDAGHRSFHR
jgi:omega-6 fatty acid desaturase (delta-12 desaturase)